MQVKEFRRRASSFLDKKFEQNFAQAFSKGLSRILPLREGDAEE